MDVLRSNYTTRARVRTFLRAVSGVSLACVLAAPAAAQSPAGRAAALRPPQVTPAPAPAAPVARGAIDDAPVQSLDSTPVTRAGRAMLPGGGGQPTGPAWLTGADANVRPASGTLPLTPAAATRPHSGAAGTTRLTQPTDQPDTATPLVSRGLNKIKGFVAGDRSPAGPGATPAAGGSPADPNAPLQAQGANGAPVLAGPPAWRWYGYGSVTPGANTYAPTGQYPKASANWYSVTKATPGAFPVPVMNPYRQAPGGEPPVYVAAVPPRPPADEVRPPETFTPPPSSATKFSPQPPALPTQPPAPPLKVGSVPVGVETPRLIPTPVPAVTLSPGAGPAAVASTTGAEPRLAAAPRPPVGVPTLVPLPVLPPPAPAKAPDPVAAVPAVTPDAEPLEAHGAHSHEKPAVTTTKPAAHAPAGSPEPAATLAPPAALPGSVTNEVKWQPTPDRADSLPPGTWAPATGAPRKPARPPADGDWQPGATNTTAPRLTARAQAGDTTPQADPAAALIRGVCRGRATDVDVRWTGSKKLMVCFETRTAPEAAAVVRDLSARPELAALQIDFCVVVK